MKVSETVMCELSRGILLERRELTTMVMTARTANFTSSSAGLRRYAETAAAPAPPAMMAHMYLVFALTSPIASPPVRHAAPRHFSSRRVDRIVKAAELEPGLAVKILRLGAPLADQEADGVGLSEQGAPQLRKTVEPQPPAAAVGPDVDALEVDHLRRLGDGVGLEDEPPAPRHDPHAPLLDPPPAAPAEAFRVGLKRVDAA